MTVKESKGEQLFNVFNVVLLMLLGIITLYPLYYVLIVSVSQSAAVSRGEVAIIPIGLNLNSYKLIIKDPNFLRSFFNTTKYTFVGTLVNLFMSAICAYPLSIRTFSGRKVFTAIIVFTMFFSGGLVPTYLVVKSLGMIDTIWAIALPTAISTWNMIIIRTSFQNIPDSLRESCYIDGANDIVIFLKIILPLSRPVLAVMTLFYATGHWNSFFPELIYLSKKSMFPLQLILRNMLISNQFSELYGDILQTSNVLPTTLNYAAIIVSTIPILLVYPFVQRYFVKGVMIGSLKG
ncbi:MAG TPA: carbohydrate ABC transporter permease [Clostridiales bacterium]|nr:carbohydrate ABC transporter permease [Clostridiales bacterium]